MNGRFWKLAERLSEPLILVTVIVIIAGQYLVRPPEGVDEVPALNIWLFGILCLITIFFAFRLYRTKEVARRADEARSKATDEAAQNRGVADSLRSVVERSLGTSSQHRDSWSRPMLRWPFTPEKIEAVIDIIKSCRDVTAALVQKEVNGNEFRDGNIRANVFLPDSQGARAGDVCNLRIPVVETHAPLGLQRGMDKADERSLLFRPNQGATGRVFVEGRAIGALTKPAWLNAKTDEERGSVKRWMYVPLRPDKDAPTLHDLTASGEQFELSIWHERKIHNRLAWIISLPLMIRYEGTLEVVGVLSVDCLEHIIEPSAIRRIFYQIAPFAGALSGILHDVPTDRVVIFRFSTHDS